MTADRSQTSRYRSTNRGRLVLSLTLMASAAGLGACKPEKAAEPRPPQPVQALAVELRPASPTWSYVGIVRPRTEADLGFRVPGKIVERLVEVGQPVVAGQALARLDATDFRLALEAQQAELAAARSGRDQAVAAEARHRVLLAQGHVATAALEQRTATADEARARVERAERALALAQNQIAYAVLVADRDGVVAALPGEVGQVIAAAQPVARIVHRNGLEAEVAVPEHMVEAVMRASATVEVWGGGHSRLPATLRELAPEAERASRTFRARFAIEGGAPVELGRTVTVHLAAQGGSLVAHVPLAAVMSEGEGAFVWVLDASGTRVRRVPVTVAALTKEHAVIADGLAPGMRIVGLGVHRLDAALPVRVVEQRLIRN